MSLEPLGTLSHNGNQKKVIFFFRVIFGGLTMPTLQVVFQNSSVIPHWSLLTAPATHRLWRAGMAAEISPAFPNSSQAGTEQGLPTGFAGAHGGEQRGKGCQLLSGLTGQPLCSLPILWVSAAWHFPLFLCMVGVVQLQEAEVGKERKYKMLLPSAVPLVTWTWSKPLREASNGSAIWVFPFAAPLPCGKIALSLPTLKDHWKTFALRPEALHASCPAGFAESSGHPRANSPGTASCSFSSWGSKGSQLTTSSLFLEHRS